MKVISWNVNGLRAWINKGKEEFLLRQDWDIMFMQETRCYIPQIPQYFSEYCLKNGINMIVNPASRAGYSGTAILYKDNIEFDNVSNKLDIPDEEFYSHALYREGRVIQAKIHDLVLIGIYVPNSKREFERLDERCKIEHQIKGYLKSLIDKGLNIVYCGDLNVAHTDKDIYNPDLYAPGNSKREKECFSSLLDIGMVDSFRKLHEDEIKYSWFSNFGNARGDNKGWRLDYILTSKSLEDKIKSADILDEYGSDHLPVMLEF